jgi:type IX secretion system PorP/SprF family membrane protein
MTPEKYTLITGIYSIIRRSGGLLILLGVLCSNAGAQDQTNFTQFYLNPYLINPSYAGADGQAALSLIYKKQWATIEGAPAIANFALQAPLSSRVGIGLSITNDSRALLNNSSVLLSFAYNIALAEHAFLRFGISGGGTWNTIDLAKLESLNDPAVANFLENNAALTGNAGISFHIKTFQLGASMPTLFSPSYTSEDAFNITEIKPFQSLIINASNRFYFGDNKYVLEPYALYRINAGLPPQFELAGILHINHLVWLGGSFKEDFGISALAGLKIKNMLAIGGSYSLQNSGENELNSPSFEISLSYLFGQRKKNTPLYSFVNTIKEEEKKPAKKSTSELIAEKRKLEEAARKKQLDEQAKQKRAEAEVKKKADELARKAKEEEEAYAKNNPPPPAIVKADTTTHQPSPLVQEPVVRTEPPKEGERHETFKRGNHSKELPAADFVIAGAFSSEANANRYSRGLQELGFKANYGHLTVKQLWYVYIFQSKDINQSRAQRDKFRKSRMFKDAWLLTVQE